MTLVVAVGPAVPRARADRNGAGDDSARSALRDGDNHYQVAIASGWRPIEPPSGTLVARVAQSGRGWLAITRVDTGTRAARDIESLAVQVERGVQRATRDFRRVRRKLARSTRAATLDLSYERAGPAGTELVLSRYLLFARHTVVLSIGLAGADRRERRAAEAMMRSFAPF